MQQTIETQEILKQKKTIESKIIEETIYYRDTNLLDTIHQRNI